jgi:hypothetical protein
LAGAVAEKSPTEVRTDKPTATIVCRALPPELNKPLWVIDFI